MDQIFTGNRFHVTIRIRNPEICNQLCLRVKRCKAKATSEKASKLKDKMNKSNPKLRKGKNWKYVVPK